MKSLGLDDATVAVTGASGGIGLACVRAFEEAGAAAYGIDVAKPAPGESAGRFIEADVTKEGDMVRALDRAAGETGRLDAVVAAAGIVRDGVLWKLSLEDWRAVLAVNLDGSFHTLRAAVPHFRKRGAGAAVLISSINGERGKFGQSNYAASKAAVIGLAKTAARELGRFNVRVNAVAPGYIDTGMTRALPAEIVRAATAESALGRLGRAEDVAGAVLFLCSRLAAHVTGQVLRVDGGQYM